MLQPLDVINVEELITEDDTPVDNWASEKQQRLLTEPLYSSWSGPGEGRTFIAAANVGIYDSVHEPAIVPDVFISLDVEVPDNWWDKHKRCYLVWEFAKAPEVVIEIVSNDEGEEEGRKKSRYARMGVAYYVIFDPQQILSGDILKVYKLDIDSRRYNRQETGWLSPLRLGLSLWQGEFEGKQANWLRWCDESGNLIPTGRERAEQERQRAEQERQQAERERQRAEQEIQLRAQAEQRAQRLAERLRALGEDPDQI